jgi:choline dehydrogenase-like flavoprotein
MPQGRALGGPRALNLQALIAPSKSDLDGWGNLGNDDWSCETYLRRFYTLSEPAKDTRQVLGLDWIDKHSKGGLGPVQASFPDGKQNAFPKAWVESFKALGFPMTGDPLFWKLCWWIQQSCDRRFSHQAAELRRDRILCPSSGANGSACYDRINGSKAGV